MSTTLQAERPRSAALAPLRQEPGWIVRLFDWKPFLIVVCLAPALGLLFVFLTYPLGLRIYLAFTDTQTGRGGEWAGLDNFESLADDPIFWRTVGYTILYTAVATVGK